MIRGTGCVNCARPDLWGLRASNCPILPGDEFDPFVCPKCGSEMKVIAVIQQPQEIRLILVHLVKQGRAPLGLDPASLN